MLLNLKKLNSNLKVLLSIGSYRDGTMQIMKISQTNAKRRDFIRNTIIYLKKFHFDGLELNWSLRNIDSVLFSNSDDKKKAKFQFTKLFQVLIHLFFVY